MINCFIISSTSKPPGNRQERFIVLYHTLTSTSCIPIWPYQIIKKTYMSVRLAKIGKRRMQKNLNNSELAMFYHT